MHLIENVQDREGHDFRYSINYDKIKKELDWEPKISFEIGIKNGALGGKILGAGGGGFLLFIAPKDAHQNILKKLKKFMFVEFKFENDGSKIIFNNLDD